MLEKKMKTGQKFSRIRAINAMKKYPQKTDAELERKLYMVIMAMQVIDGEILQELSNTMNVI